MLHWNQAQKPDVTELKRMAFRLGLDVGENNHIDTVGWVRTELTSILNAALKAGELQEVRQVYERGKRQGMARRNAQVTRQSAAAGKTKVPAAGPAISSAAASKPIALKDAEGFVERIAPQQGLRSTIGVMKHVADDPEARKDLNGLFAGIFDMQERILDIENDGDRRKTFERGLDMLHAAGWIEDFEIASFDDSRAVVALRSTTAIAKAFGHSDTPLCQPICNLLETIGRKTFSVSVAVTEIECCAQGKSACRFEITKRACSG